MKLLVYNIPNTLNYGSMMMAENLFYYLARKLGENALELLVVTPKAEETCSRLSAALGQKVRNVTIKAIHPSEVITGRKIARILSQVTGVGFKDRLLPEVQEIDGLVVLGGDDFTEDGGYLGPMGLLVRFMGFANIGKKVIMCGQTIGPFYSWRELIVKQLFKTVTKIIARDPITYRYLTDGLKLTNVFLAADLAFLPLAREGDFGGTKIDDEYFTVVPSELVWKFACEKDRAAYMRVLTNIAAYILECFHDSKLLILPHVLAPEDVDDTLSGRDLFLSLKRRGIESSRVIFEQRQLLPFQARQLLAGSKLVFTGRMHAAISSFTCGVPAVSLSYSRKYWGIIGEYLGMGDYIIDVREHTWDGVEKMSLDQLKRIVESYGDVQRDIATKILEMRNKAYEGIGQVASLLSRS